MAHHTNDAGCGSPPKPPRLLLSCSSLLRSCNYYSTDSHQAVVCRWLSIVPTENGTKVTISSEEDENWGTQNCLVGSSLIPMAARIMDGSTSSATTATDLDPDDSTIRMAHELLDVHSHRHRGESSWWMAAEECLWNLSRLHTLESADLCFLLLDTMINKIELHEQQEMLQNFDLWHAVLLNWQAVCKEQFEQQQQRHRRRLHQHPHDDNNNPRHHHHFLGHHHLGLDLQPPSPAKVLAMLDSWNKQLQETTTKASTDDETEGEEDAGVFRAPSFVTAKALSYILHVCGLQGKALEKQQRKPSSKEELLQLAQLAESILMRMLEGRRQNKLPPSTTNLNVVLLLWCRLGQVDRAWKVLEEAGDGSADGIPLDLHTYNAILYGHAKNGDGQAAECVLRDIPNPDVTSWNLALSAWSKAKKSEQKLAAERTEQILVSMMMYGTDSPDEQEESSLHGDHHHQPSSSTSSSPATFSRRFFPNFSLRNGGSSSSGRDPPFTRITRPDLTSFNTALATWARAGEADTCYRLLKEMQDLHKADKLEAPDDVSFATVLNAFAKAGQYRQAQQLSDEMYQAYMNYGVASMKPTIWTMTTILDAYARAMHASKKDTPHILRCIKEARLVWDRMIELHQYGLLADSPDTSAYNCMMTCYLRSCEADTFPNVNTGAEQADKLLQEMKRPSSSAKPDVASYVIVIQAWLQRRDGVQRAVQLLEELARNDMLRPNPSSLHCIIIGFCRSERPDIAHQLLQGICESKRKDPQNVTEPRISIFGCVVGAWHRSNDPQRFQHVQKLVADMETMHADGLLANGPDEMIYTTLVKCWANSTGENSVEQAYDALSKMKRLGMQPDVDTYNCVLWACTRGHGVNPFLAEQVLKEMYEDSLKDPNKAKPDTKSFNTALNAWARYNHPRSMERAASLFSEMQRLNQINIISYNTFLNCLAQASNRKAAEQAERLLCSMLSAAGSGNSAIKPNHISYGSVIKAWLRAGDTAAADRVLCDMCQKYLTSGDPSYKPDIRIFPNVLRSWNASENQVAAAERIPLLQELRTKVHAASTRN